MPDFIGFRFESTAARFLAAIIVLFASLFYMTAVFKGIGNLLETFMDIPYKLSIALVFMVVMLYTAVGAIELIRQAPETSHLFTWGGGVAVPTLFGVLVAGTIKFAVEPRQLSRFYALEGAQATRTGMLVSTLTFTAVYSLIVPVGLYARRIIPGSVEDTDLIVPTLLATEGVFSSLGAAFLVVAMVAAAMSSLDSVLLVMASTAERDIVGLLRPPRLRRGGVACHAALCGYLRAGYRRDRPESARWYRHSHSAFRQPLRRVFPSRHRSGPLLA